MRFSCDGRPHRQRENVYTDLAGIDDVQDLRETFYAFLCLESRFILKQIFARNASERIPAYHRRPAV